MPVLYVNEQYTTLKKEDERVKLCKGKDILTDIPMKDIEQVVLFGNVTITQPLIEELMEKKIDICYLTKYGKYLGRLMPQEGKNLYIRKAQSKHHNDELASLKIAKQFIKGKLKNSRTFLLRYNRNMENQQLKIIINQLKNIERFMDNVKDKNQLMGYEGEASRDYFNGYSIILNDNFGFDKRIKRPPTDPVNAMLSFGYTLLSSDITSAIHIVGLDPYLGFLHDERYGRPSLALDLMEEFRAIIVDSVVATLINNGMVKVNDFEKELNYCYMSDETKKTFMRKYEERKNTEIIHPIFGYKIAYKRCFELQARLLAKYLNGEIEDYIPFKVR